jgi:3-oxoacyl-[acyl-carrier protein] reductase
MKVLVTGGTGDIGKDIIKLFESKGFNITAPSRSDLDLSTHFELNDQYSEFDIIINNAGINPLKPIEDVTDNEVMQINYFSPLKVIQKSLPHMIGKGFGRIVNIGSIWGELSKPNRSAYSASKSALDSLARSITAEYGKYNILANTISPGFIATQLTYKNNSEDAIRYLINGIPIGRLGSTLEIAKLAYFLTMENSYISGQNIKIDGGYSCVRY